MLLLALAGLAAGFVDSMIGGGGLITVPALMLHLGVTPAAVGTNKIAGAAATWAALLVYGLGRRVPWAPAARFAAAAAAGSVAGAWASPRFLTPAYPVFLWAGSALCVGTLLYKDRILAARPAPGGPRALPAGAVALGALAGLYDGAWGPGGGTFLFLALVYGTRWSLMECMAAAKLANAATSSLALGTFAAQGLVRWEYGGVLALSLGVGAWTGAHVALRHAERVVAPILLVVTALLLLRLTF